MKKNLEMYTTRTPCAKSALVVMCAVPLFLLSACSDDNDTPATVPVNEGETTDTTDTTGMTPGSANQITESLEALHAFLLQDDSGPDASPHEFFHCSFSNESADSYLGFSSTGDALDPGFNPLELLGNLRGQQLDGDPRPTNDGETLAMATVVGTVTCSDSVLMELRSIGYAGAPESAFDLTTVRLGPGRTFSADESLGNTKISCTETPSDLLIFF